jgi:putative endonuclease
LPGPNRSIRPISISQLPNYPITQFFLAFGLLGRFGVSSDRIDLGRTGEDLACQELQRRGYAIVARRYRCPAGELDIVARDGQTLVFVEVKTRRGSRFGRAVEAVTAAKQRKISALAVQYLARHNAFGRSCRFDVVAITVGADGTTIDVLQNAFDAAE